MAAKPKRLAGGSNQVNVGFSDEDYQVLQAYIQIKGLRTVQDGIRAMVKGARDFVGRQLKTSTPSKPAAIAAAEISSSPTPAVDQVESNDVSDDGMSMPSMDIAAPVQPELDEDGQELSDSEKMRRARLKPAMDVENTRWASLRDEV